jgi:general secretion pathway protein C
LLWRKRVEVLLHKYLWIVDLVVVAVSATLLAGAAADLVAMKLVDTPTTKPAASKARPRYSGPGFDKDPTAIAQRNIFCADCPSGAAGAEPADGARERRTTLPLALLAVMYAPPPAAPTLSIAIVKETTSRATGAFAIGARILGATITRILERRVYLDRDGRTEYLDLVETAAPAVGEQELRTAHVDAFAAAVERGVRQKAERRYDIQRTMLDTVLDNVALLARSVRAIPEVRGGAMVGFRVFAVGPDGVLGKLGVRNGDVVASINGLELTSSEKVVEAYGKLKSASHLSLRLERDGARIANEYDIR